MKNHIKYKIFESVQSIIDELKYIMYDIQNIDPRFVDSSTLYKLEKECGTELQKKFVDTGKIEKYWIAVQPHNNPTIWGIKKKYVPYDVGHDERHAWPRKLACIVVKFPNIEMKYAIYGELTEDDRYEM